MTKILTSGELFDRLHQAGMFKDEPSMVRRVIIDLQHGTVAKVYVERFADAEALDIAFGADLEITGTR